MFNLFFRWMQKIGGGELSQQIINERETDMYLKVKPSSELLYKKLEEGFIFLDMSQVCTCV
jgi:hypothetical protein